MIHGTLTLRNTDLPTGPLPSMAKQGRKKKQRNVQKDTATYEYV